MPLESVLLLGNEHPEPSSFEVKEVSPDIVIGISAVVDKSIGAHNRVNNEDSCGICVDTETDTLIAMVADAHDGHVASHEAVKRFPEILRSHLTASLPPEHIMQAYVDAMLDFYVQMYHVRRKLGITYPIQNGTSIDDNSESTFHSVIRVGGNYYAAPCGDSFTAVIRDKEMNIVKPVCNHYIGVINLREKIREAAFDYGGKYRKISKSFRRKWKAKQGDDKDKAQNRIIEEENAALRRLSDEFKAMPDPDMSYTKEYVRKVIPVYKLEVQPEDIIFQCTDGIRLDSHGWRKRAAPPEYICKAFSGRSLYKGVQYIFQGVQKKEVDIEMDNLAITAVRVK